MKIVRLPSFVISIVSSTILASCVVSSVTAAPGASFTSGPVISSYGKHAPVPNINLSAEHTFKVAFDVAQGADAGQVNAGFNSLARFINMHVANGAAAGNIQLALVVHGAATLDVLNNTSYKKAKNNTNANIPLLKALQKNGVKVIVCGQSSAAHNVTSDMLMEGVHMDLSAMTAHARLQQAGYTLNPF